MNKVNQLKQEVPERSQFLKNVSAELRWYCYTDLVDLDDFLNAFKNKYKNSIEFYGTNNSENRLVCDEIEVMKILLEQSPKLIESKVRAMGMRNARMFILSCMAENTYSRARSLSVCSLRISKLGFVQRINNKFFKRSERGFDSLAIEGGL